jgi:hypothetical protein
MSPLLRPRHRTSPPLSPPERPSRLPGEARQGQPDPPEVTSAIALSAKKRGSGHGGARPPARRQARAAPHSEHTFPRLIPVPARRASAHPQSLRLASPLTPHQDRPGNLAATAAPFPELQVLYPECPDMDGPYLDRQRTGIRAERRSAHVKIGCCACRADPGGSFSQGAGCDWRSCHPVSCHSLRLGGAEPGGPGGAPAPGPRSACPRWPAGAAGRGSPRRTPAPRAGASTAPIPRIVTGRVRRGPGCHHLGAARGNSIHQVAPASW